MSDGARFIGDVEVHPAAELFPEMGGEDFEHLKRSIAEHGIRVPLTFYENKLLDGRNRLRAYMAAGLPLSRLPREGILPSADPYAFAWDRNCERLDYTPSQKAAIGLKITEASGALAKAKAEAEAAANAARSEAAKKQHAESNPRRGEKSGPGSREPLPKKTGSPEARALADKAHVSISTARRVLDLKEQDPVAFEHLAATGEMPTKPKREPTIVLDGSPDDEEAPPKASPFSFDAEVAPHVTALRRAVQRCSLADLDRIATQIQAVAERIADRRLALTTKP